MINTTMLRHHIIALACAASAFACTDSGKDEKKKNGATGDAKAEAEPECEKDCDTKTATTPSGGGLGLASFCTYAAGADGKGCFTCTPRELPNTKCIALPAGFDPASKCKYDLDRLTCDLGDANAFTFDFADLASGEDIFGNLETVKIAAKAMLSKPLDSKPEIRNLVFKLLDSMVEHKLALFTGGDIGPVIDDIHPEMKAAKVDVTDGQIASVRTVLQKLASDFAAKRAAGPITYEDAFSVFNSAFKALPPEVIGSTQGTGLEEFAASLKGKNFEDLLALLSQALGDAAMQDILNQLSGEPATEQP